MLADHLAPREPALSRWDRREQKAALDGSTLSGDLESVLEDSPLGTAVAPLSRSR